MGSIPRANIRNVDTFNPSLRVDKYALVVSFLKMAKLTIFMTGRADARAVVLGASGFDILYVCGHGVARLISHKPVYANWQPIDQR